VSESTTRFGTVSVVGRPNVGKSTLVNQLLGESLSITADRPQTTRHRILGVVTRGATQVALLDTPGIHGNARRQLNRSLNRSATGALTGVDVVLFVVAAQRWTDDDDLVLQRLGEVEAPVIGIVNRVDQVADKSQLLPFLEEFAGRHPFAAIVPLSARTGDNVAALWQELEALLPAGEHAFDPDTLTDRSERFLAAELVREQLVRRYGDELPYAVSVSIEAFGNEPSGLIRIGAVIWVERDSQKAIVIGRGGEKLRDTGTAARMRMERLFGGRVHLDLWVKVRADWSNDARALREFGYDEP